MESRWSWLVHVSSTLEKTNFVNSIAPTWHQNCCETNKLLPKTSMLNSTNTLTSLVTRLRNLHMRHRRGNHDFWRRQCRRSWLQRIDFDFVYTHKFRLFIAGTHSGCFDESFKEFLQETRRRRNPDFFRGRSQKSASISAKTRPRFRQRKKPQNLNETYLVSRDVLISIVYSRPI